MGRRGAAGDRERAARQARVVRHVPAARRAARVLLLRRHLPALSSTGSPTNSSSASAGGCRFSPARVLVIVGLYVRLTITETPVFREALERRERVKVPMVVVLRDHIRNARPRHARVARDVRALLPDDGVRAVVGHDARSASRASSSWSCSWSASLFFALTIPISAVLAERGRRGTLMWVTVGDRRSSAWSWRRCSRPARWRAC